MARMARSLTVTYDKSNEDKPVLCVAEGNVFSVTLLKIFTGERAEQLFNELTGQKNISMESEGGDESV